MSEEMRAHLELQAAENEKRGLSREEARYAAMRAFGGEEQIKERVCDQWRLWPAGMSFLRELGFALLLAPNAMLALDALGVADPITAGGVVVAKGEMRRADGSILRRLRYAFAASRSPISRPCRSAACSSSSRSSRSKAAKRRLRATW